ncbi:hypothetical protein QP157_02850 [Sphingomonas sp. LR61]
MGIVEGSSALDVDDDQDGVAGDGEHAGGSFRDGSCSGWGPVRAVAVIL